MAWHIDEEFIKDDDGNVICVILPNVASFHVTIIKKIPKLFGLMVEFVGFYEDKRIISKKLYDNLLNLIEIEKDYNFKWHIDSKGDIADEENNKICFFLEKNTHDAIVIQFAPEIFKIAKEIVKNFNNRRAIQQPTYKNWLLIMDAIDEY